jgi:hypothetical protein
MILNDIILFHEHCKNENNGGGGCGGGDIKTSSLYQNFK